MFPLEIDPCKLVATSDLKPQCSCESCEAIACYVHENSIHHMLVPEFWISHDQLAQLLNPERRVSGRAYYEYMQQHSPAMQEQMPPRLKGKLTVIFGSSTARRSPSGMI